MDKLRKCFLSFLISIFILIGVIIFSGTIAEAFSVDKFLFGYLIFNMLLFTVVLIAIKIKLRFTIVLVMLLVVMSHCIMYNVVKIELYGDFLGYFNRSSYIASGELYPGLYLGIFPHIIPYPAFMSLLLKFFGVHRVIFFAVNELAVIGIVHMVYLLSKRFSAEKLSCFVALAVGINPLMSVYCLMPNAEIIFTFFIMCAITLYLNIPDIVSKKSIFYTVSVGFLIGAANFFRPTGLICVIALIISSCIYKRRRTAAQIFILLIIPFAICSFITDKICESLSGYAPVKAAYGWNLFVGSSETGQWNADDAELFALQCSENKTPDEIQTFFKEKGIERYMKMGINILPHFAGKLFQMNSPGNAVLLLGHQSYGSHLNEGESSDIYKLSLSLYFIPFYFFAVIGCIFAVKSHGEYPVILLIYLLGCLLSFIILESSGRYSVSYMPFWGILAGYGLKAQRNMFILLKSKYLPRS